VESNGKFAEAKFQFIGESARNVEAKLPSPAAGAAAFWCTGSGLRRFGGGLEVSGVQRSSARLENSS